MEITTELTLTPSEHSMLDMHSVLNVLTVLQYEFMRLEPLLEDPDEVMTLVEEIAAASAALADPNQAYRLLENVDGLRQTCGARLQSIFAEALPPGQ